MKLLYITNGITGSGGLERVLSIKASKLATDFGYEVHIVTLNEQGKMPFYTFSEKIHWHHVQTNSGGWQYFKQYKNGLKALVKQIQPDVISVCDDGLKGFFLPWLLQKPCAMIYERHASVLLNSKGASGVTSFRHHINHWLMKKMAKNFDAFVVLTKGNIKEWGSYVTVIPNPLSFEIMEKEIPKKNIVLAVGSHSYNKGYDLLIKAWRIIDELNTGWELHIYGNKEIPFSKNYLNDETLPETISFFDPIKDIQSKYGEASIYVMPSRSEGFGMVLIEAMACGLPCVSFDCPHGPSDIISQDEDGILVPNGDVEALSVALLKLIEDENLRKQMGANAKMNVKRYEANTVVTKWDELFKKLKG